MGTKWCAYPAPMKNGISFSKTSWKDTTSGFLSSSNFSIRERCRSPSTFTFKKLIDWFMWITTQARLSSSMYIKNFLCKKFVLVILHMKPKPKVPNNSNSLWWENVLLILPCLSWWGAKSEVLKISICLRWENMCFSYCPDRGNMRSPQFFSHRRRHERICASEFALIGANSEVLKISICLRMGKYVLLILPW